MSNQPQSAERSWHTLTLDEARSRLDSPPSGLAADEARKRLEKYGPNQLQAGRRVSALWILLGQFKNVLIIILLVAIVFSAFVGHQVEAITIGIIVLFAILLGFIQEYRAERALEALGKMAAPHATVLRGGKEENIAAAELVPGDVLVVKAGDRLAADVRVLEAASLSIEEAALTGESQAVDKQTERLERADLELGNRTNMLFAGTTVSRGRGKGLVVATGMETEFGKIAGMLETVEIRATPLQQNLDKIGRRLALASLVIVAIIVAAGLLRQQPLIEMFIFGIALAVAVVPEALPAVVTVSLAIGVRRMAKRHALIRRLPAVETLGSTSVICSDKTGTLTKDEMTARKVVVGDETWEITGAGYEPRGDFRHDGQAAKPPEAIERLLKAAALSSDASLNREPSDGQPKIQGDPTEAALVVAAAKAGLEKPQLEQEQPRTDEIPFTSESKRMTTLHKTSEGLIAYTKGAPEVIVPTCTRQLSAGGEKLELDAAGREQVLAAANTLANEALRVLAVAYRRVASRDEAQEQLTLLGLVGLLDPPRPEAQAAVEACRKAGIRPIMITGDHPTTAEAIARELGILQGGRVLPGAELEKLSEEDYRRIVDEIEVYARVSPAHKLRVVTMLQEKGRVVAMTGDGVNDAPALKKADIGIAMGVTGTDVSKEAADMTLTDDNFATIVAAIEEGRIVFGNIKKYLMYLLSSNIGEIGLMAGTSLAGLPLPLTAVQLLYVNLATDGLPALALAVDPPEADLMQRPPRDPKTGIFTRPVVLLLLIGGLWSAAANFGLFAWAIQSGRSAEEAMSMTFVSLVLIQFFKAYNYRSDHLSVFSRPLANKWLNLAILWEIVLLVLILYVPFLQGPFKTFPLTIVDWLIIGVVSLTISPVLEGAKWLARHSWLGKA